MPRAGWGSRQASTYTSDASPPPGTVTSQSSALHCGEPSLDPERQEEQPNQNCAFSVEPWSATVEELPPVMTWITWSKYPVPTSRWCRVAEYPWASDANSAS